MPKEEAPHRQDDVITVPQMAKRLKVSPERAYELIAIKGFPLLNIGGERGNRVIWGDVLEWLRTNMKAR